MPERSAVGSRGGLQHGGYFARRVFEVQVNQLDDKVWLALGLYLSKSFEQGHVNRIKRRRISARAQRRHQLPVRDSMYFNVDGRHHGLLSPVRARRGVRDNL